MSGFLEATIDKFILRVKKDLRYSSDHVWVREGDQHCTLGLPTPIYQQNHHFIRCGYTSLETFTRSLTSCSPCGSDDIA